MASLKLYSWLVVLGSLAAVSCESGHDSAQAPGPGSGDVVTALNQASSNGQLPGSGGSVVMAATTSSSTSAETLETAPFTAGQVIARLKNDPNDVNQTNFLLRGVVPLPRGYYPDAAGRLHFGVRDSDGTVLPAQVEIVGRYADGLADMVEIIARIQGPAAAAPGGFDVLEIDYPAGVPARPDLRTALFNDLGLSPELLDLLASPGKLAVVAVDVHRNLYAMDLLADAKGFEVLRLGHQAVQLRSSGTLEPLVAGSGNKPSLDHLLGINAFLTAWRSENVLSLDLHVHSGILDDPAAPTPLSKTYFQGLYLFVPPGWSVSQDLADPAAGALINTTNFNLLPLIAPLSDGSMNVFERQGQLTRRLVLSPVGQEDAAEFFLNHDGLAFAQTGVNAANTRLFSWDNPLTASYLPQKLAIGVDNFLNPGFLAQRNSDYFQQYKDLLEDPNASAYPFSDANIGPFFPIYGAYGGMTGGNGIEFHPGAQIIMASSRGAYLLWQLKLRAVVERQPTALFKLDGTPASILDFVQTTSNGTAYVPFSFSHRPGSWDSDIYFGLNAGPNPHVQFVEANGLQPNYEAKLLSYMPIDHQHLIRFTGPAKAMAYLGNDAMARQVLRMEAELAILTYHSLPNNANLGYKPGSLYSHLLTSAATPGLGIKGMGREHAWMFDAVNASYDLGDDRFRAVAAAWYQKVIQAIAQGQIGCTGQIGTKYIPHKLFANYYGEQAFERHLLQSSLKGILSSVLEGSGNLADEVALTNALLANLRHTIADYSWNSAFAGPYKFFASESFLAPGTLFCTTPPADGVSPTMIEKTYALNAFSLGYQLSGDPAFLDRAVELTGGTMSALQLKLEKWEYSHNLENEASLLGLLQELGWQY